MMGLLLTRQGSLALPHNPPCRLLYVCVAPNPPDSCFASVSASLRSSTMLPSPARFCPPICAPFACL